MDRCKREEGHVGKTWEQMSRLFSQRHEVSLEDLVLPLKGLHAEQV